MLDPRLCYRQGGCGPYEARSCSECPASKPEYAERYKDKENTKMRATLVIDGKEFPIDILDPALQEIISPKAKRKTGYERVELKDSYYFVDGYGDICTRYKGNVHDDDLLHVIDNCYSDKTIAENNARADKLMRQLRRFAVEHRKDTIDYNDGAYEICYDYESKNIYIMDVSLMKYIGTIPFDTFATAQLAIDTFHDELIWYFTEYKDSL